MLGKLHITSKRTKLDPYLTPHTNINLKWIKGLNIKTVKLLDENIREKLQDIGLGTDNQKKTKQVGLSNHQRHLEPKQKTL